MLLFGSKNWVVTPRMGKALGGDPGPGVKTVDGTALAEDTIWEVEIHLDGDGKGGGRVIENGRINLVAPEHGHTVHRYAITVKSV